MKERTSFVILTKNLKTNLGERHYFLEESGNPTPSPFRSTGTSVPRTQESTRKFICGGGGDESVSSGERGRRSKL